MHTVLTAIVFLPLLGALIAGLFGTKVFKGLGRDADVYGEHHAHAHDDHDGARRMTTTAITAIMTARPGRCT